MRDRERVNAYAFGTRTAQFHICANCGIVPLVTSLIADRLFAVVNVNTFDDVNAVRLNRIPASFDGESEGDRLKRRERYWISSVTYEK